MIFKNKTKRMKSTLKNGIFTFEIDGYAVELYKENGIY